MIYTISVCGMSTLTWSISGKVVRIVDKPHTRLVMSGAHHSYIPSILTRDELRERAPPALGHRYTGEILGKASESGKFMPAAFRQEI